MDDPHVNCNDGVLEDPKGGTYEHLVKEATMFYLFAELFLG